MRENKGIPLKPLLGRKQAGGGGVKWYNWMTMGRRRNWTVKEDTTIPKGKRYVVGNVGIVGGATLYVKGHLACRQILEGSLGSGKKPKRLAAVGHVCFMRGGSVELTARRAVKIFKKGVKRERKKR